MGVMGVPWMKNQSHVLVLFELSLWSVTVLNFNLSANLLQVE